MALHKSRIEWCDYTWNPVTGCRHGCSYCYARRIADRFKPQACERPAIEPVEYLPRGSGLYYLDVPAQVVDQDGRRLRGTPYPKGFEPTFHAYTLDFPQHMDKPSKIFVSSMGDLFGEWVPDSWIETVFEAAEKAPQHTYLFLTKNPSRYLEMALAHKLPDRENFWYGTTITGPENPFFGVPGYKTFLSIEPLLEPFRKEGEDGMNPFYLTSIGWVIVGAMTGPGSKHNQPERQWIENIMDAAAGAGIPVFLKDSLRPIWGEELVQAYPAGMPGWIPGHKPIPKCRECQDRVEVPQGKRGTAIRCTAELDTNRCPRSVGARYARTSPPWCPRRKEAE